MAVHISSVVASEPLVDDGSLPEPGSVAGEAGAHVVAGDAPERPLTAGTPMGAEEAELEEEMQRLEEELGLSPKWPRAAAAGAAGGSMGAA